MEGNPALNGTAMGKRYDTLLEQLKGLKDNRLDPAEILEEWGPVLKEQERNTEILQAVYDNITLALLVIDAETRSIIHCNPAAEDIFGYSPNELTGRSTRFIHVDQKHYDRYAGESEPVLDRGESYHTEYPLLRKDGSRFQAEIITTPIEPAGTWLNGIVSIIKDVTAEKKKEEHRRRNINRLRMMTEQHPTIL